MLWFACVGGFLVYAKIEGKSERTPLKMMPRRVENGAKMAPKWLPGGLWAPILLPEAPLRPLERLWGGSWGRLGGSWGAPGASWAAPGAHFGSPGAAFWSFFGLREVILEGICATGACSEKKVSKSSVFHYFLMFFGVVFCVVFFALLAAPARERTLKKQQMAWRVLHYSHVGRLRSKRKRGRRRM